MHGFALRVPRHGGQSAHSLEDPRKAGPFRVWSVLSEAGHAQDDQVRLERPQHLLGQAPTVQRARPEVLDQYIELGQQPLEKIHAFRNAQVQCAEAFASLGGLPPYASAVLERRERAHAVAFARQFQLEHIGAVVGEQRGGEGAGQDRGDVQYLEPGQGARHGVAFLRHFCTSWRAMISFMISLAPP
ncbi:hypothetical protein D9M68_651450 [compost metagenome]